MSLNQRHYLEDQRHYVTPWPVASRAGNPATSHQAEAAHTKSGRRETHVALLLRWIREHPGLTRSGITENITLSDYEASKRLSDLERLGKIRKGPPQRAADTGRMQSTWWLVGPDMGQTLQVRRGPDALGGRLHVDRACKDSR